MIAYKKENREFIGNFAFLRCNLTSVKMLLRLNGELGPKYCWAGVESKEIYTFLLSTGETSLQIVLRPRSGQ